MSRRTIPQLLAFTCLVLLPATAGGDDDDNGGGGGSIENGSDSCSR
jgi:hypothetical protein